MAVIESDKTLALQCLQKLWDPPIAIYVKTKQIHPTIFLKAQMHYTLNITATMIQMVECVKLYHIMSSVSPKWYFNPYPNKCGRGCYRLQTKADWLPVLFDAQICFGSEEMEKAAEEKGTIPNLQEDPSQQHKQYFLLIADNQRHKIPSVIVMGNKNKNSSN